MSDMGQYPVLEILEGLKKALAAGNTAILQAPPGAGKSTVLPLQLLDAPWLAGQKMVMLEPRRLAARAVATRMASLLGEDMGQTVGYRVRFESRTSARTRIEVVTEGILTRMIQTDNALEGVGLVIFDEFHERNLQADLGLALCREVQQVLRDDFRILIMSATLDGERLSQLLGGAPLLTSLGRQFPVEVAWQPVPPDERLHLSVAKAVRRAAVQHPGDILAFLPGAGEIQRTQELLELDLPGVQLHPLFGDLPPRQQQEALLPDPQGRRKVVLATTIAETSLTIEGVGIVVDSGYARSPRFDPRSGLTRLETLRITKDAADQRAGRAGRLGPGVCIRLWSKATHVQLADHRKPEIMEADLAPLVLELAQWGVNDIKSLAWLTLPPTGAVAQATELLEQLGALKKGKVTPRGKELLRLPTHPRLAHLLLEGKDAGLSPLAADVAALLEERDPLPRGAGTDLTARVEALRAHRAGQKTAGSRGILERAAKLAANWRRLLKADEDNAPAQHEDVGRLIAAAYPERVARRRDKRPVYRLGNGRTARMDDDDPLAREEWLAVAHLDAGLAEGRIYLAAPVAPGELEELHAERETVEWDTQAQTLKAVHQKLVAGLVWQERPLKAIPQDLRVKAVLQAIRKDARLLPWDGNTAQWQARVLSLKRWRADEHWPDVSADALMATLDEWLAPYLATVRNRDDLQRLDLPTILQQMLPYPQQQRLARLAPADIEVPSGSSIKLQYAPDGSPPVLAVRLQELFGLLETPTVNEGRNPVTLHLLSPGYKPVQVTQDLKSFWANTYAEVKKELKARYPKHSWPDDPYTAPAVRGARRRG